MSYFTDNPYVGSGLLPDSASGVQDYIDSGTIRIAYATYRHDPDRIEVCIHALRFLLEREIELITDEIKKKLFPAEAVCVFTFDSAISDCDANTELSSEALRELWCEFSPQLEPILRRCRMEKHGNEFVVFAPPRYILALTQPNILNFRRNFNR